MVDATAAGEIVVAGVGDAVAVGAAVGVVDEPLIDRKSQAQEQTAYEKGNARNSEPFRRALSTMVLPRCEYYRLR